MRIFGILQRSETITFISKSIEWPKFQFRTSSSSRDPTVLLVDLQFGRQGQKGTDLVTGRVLY